MDILKVVAIGVVLSFSVILIKQIKPEFAGVVLIAGSVVMISIIFKYFTNILQVIDNIIDKTGINKDMFLIILKIIGVGYLVEFGASICNDSGNSAIANKILLAGKLIILVISMPIITSLLDIIIGLLP